MDSGMHALGRALGLEGEAGLLEPSPKLILVSPQPCLASGVLGGNDQAFGVCLGEGAESVAALGVQRV
jgi:hypothetical protein